jgi:hypothetical protein
MTDLRRVRRKQNRKKIKRKKANGIGMVDVLGDDRCAILSMHNRGSAAPEDHEADQWVLCTRASWPAPSCQSVTSK